MLKSLNIPKINSLLEHSYCPYMQTLAAYSKLTLCLTCSLLRKYLLLCFLMDLTDYLHSYWTRCLLSSERWRGLRTSRHNDCGANTFSPGWVLASFLLLSHCPQWQWDFVANDASESFRDSYLRSLDRNSMGLLLWRRQRWVSMAVLWPAVQVMVEGDLTLLKNCLFMYREKTWNMNTAGLWWGQKITRK